MLDPVVSILVMLGGAVLFATAALHKLRAPAAFGAALAEYRILPSGSASVAVAVLIVLEVAVALGLVLKDTRAGAAILGAALLLLYAGAIMTNIVRGRRDLDCGCGAQRKTIAGWMVARNLLLAAALLSLCLPVGTRALGIGDLATIGAGLAVAVLLYVSADLLLSRAAPRSLFSTEHP